MCASVFVYVRVVGCVKEREREREQRQPRERVLGSLHGGTFQPDFCNKGTCVPR